MPSSHPSLANVASEFGQARQAWRANEAGNRPDRIRTLGGPVDNRQADAARGARYLDEVTWTTKNWLHVGLQKQRISVVLHTAIAEARADCE